MKKKAAKLASQFQLDAGKCDKNGTSSIFKGVSIYVNGYTGKLAIISGFHDNG